MYLITQWWPSHHHQSPLDTSFGTTNICCFSEWTMISAEIWENLCLVCSCLWVSQRAVINQQGIPEYRCQIRPEITAWSSWICYITFGIILYQICRFASRKTLQGHASRVQAQDTLGRMASVNPPLQCLLSVKSGQTPFYTMRCIGDVLLAPYFYFIWHLIRAG